MKTLSKAVAIASLVSASALTAQVANAEVSASASVANLYLWRGQNLGANGAPVMAGSLDYSAESGLYAGIWSSSGDTSFGTETDLYVGFAGEAGSLSYDIGYATYLYSGEDDVNDVAELIIGVGVDAYSATIYKSTDADANGDYLYLELGAEFGDYGLTVGNVSGSEGSTFTSDYTHVDLSYAYNDKLSFTYSQVVAEDVEDSMDMGGLFVVSYELPIE